MRLLVISQYYRPEPVPKPSELAEDFVRRGHRVEVITGFPNYPSGRLYPPYKLRLIQHEPIDGVAVTRMWLWPYHGRSTLGRMLNYATAMVGAVAGAFFTRDCDAIYAWHPPLTIGVSAAIVAAIKRAPLVYDVQDIWPESAVWAGMIKSPLLIWLLHRMEKFVYRRAAHILVVTDGAKTNLIGKGVEPDRISVAAHWIDDELFERQDLAPEPVRERYGLGNEFIVMFAGNIGVVQGLESVLYAAQRLRGAPVRFVIIGDGSDKARLMDIAAERALTNVVFVDRQPMDRMPAWFAAADALLVHLKDSAMATLAIPTKTLAYLATGKPILMATTGAAADLISRADAGIVTRPDDPEALAAAVQVLAAMSADERARLGDNGRRYLRAYYSKRHVLGEYERLIGAVACGESAVTMARSAPVPGDVGPGCQE